jgi:hypothetical protein
MLQPPRSFFETSHHGEPGKGANPAIAPSKSEFEPVDRNLDFAADVSANPQRRAVAGAHVERSYFNRENCALVTLDSIRRFSCDPKRYLLNPYANERRLGVACNSSDLNMNYAEGFLREHSVTAGTPHAKTSGWVDLAIPSPPTSA